MGAPYGAPTLDMYHICDKLSIYMLFHCKFKSFGKVS